MLTLVEGNVIGLDFDNTIANYSKVLRKVGHTMGLCPTLESKKKIRDAVRELANGDELWQSIQTQIYGAKVLEAQIERGVSEFLMACKQSSVKVVIISHKTKFPEYGNSRTNLRDVAVTWLEKHGFFSPLGLSRNDVYFASTKSEKVTLISQMNLTVFVDDLEEILTDPRFPKGTFGVLFDPNNVSDTISEPSPYHPYYRVDCFYKLKRELFD